MPFISFIPFVCFVVNLCLRDPRFGTARTDAVAAGLACPHVVILLDFATASLASRALC